MSNQARRVIVWITVAVSAVFGTLVVLLVWVFGLSRAAEDYCTSQPFPLPDTTISYPPSWTGLTTVTCKYTPPHGPQRSYDIQDAAPLEWTLILAVILLVSLTVLIVIGVLISRRWARSRPDVLTVRPA